MGAGWGTRVQAPRTALSPRVVLGLLAAMAVLVVILGDVIGPELAPPSMQAVPLLLGGLLLTPARLRVLDVVVVCCLAWSVWDLGLAAVRPGALVVIAAAAVLAHALARSRAETGLSGARGGGLLVELRERLRAQGELPQLPAGWMAEVVLKPAGGSPFAGDFVVSNLDRRGDVLELALVDVSGKGVDAGTRALLLSGALGGLLGAVPSNLFLAAANRYLVRQEWEDGFATAVHVVLDLRQGTFVVESAGHPPTARYDAGSGRWSLLESGGLALGILPEVTYVGDRGRLDPGDALLLYTDGLVEVPGRDLWLGIDKLLGEAERLVPRGFHRGGELLVQRVAQGSDDRGLVLITRSR